MNSIGGPTKCRRALVALVCVAAIALAASTGGAAWLQQEDAVYRTYYWDDYSHPKLRYSYTTNHQWWHYSSVGTTWYRLSDAVLPDTFIGSGSWYDLKNGWGYYYNTSNDYGHWRQGNTGAWRLAYRYLDGQWGHHGAYDTGTVLAASGLTATFIGTGSWYDLKNGWGYYYDTSNGFGHWRQGNTGAWRLAYRYSDGQWRHHGAYDTGTILATSGVASEFIGTSSWHSLANGWQYKYVTGEGKGFWKDAFNHQFVYVYASGQWWDYLSSEWGRLGLAGIGSQFIADGQNHPFSDSEYFRYTGSSYYWRTGSIDRFRYDYSSGQWYEWWGDGTGWKELYADSYDVDVRYNGVHDFVTRYRAADYGTDPPPGDPTYNIVYHVREMDLETWGWWDTFEWTIHRPGADNKWSGGLLNVMWLHKLDNSMLSVAEYTVEDVIVFKEDMGNFGMFAVGDALTCVRNYYRKPISTMGFVAPGTSTGFNIGEWIDETNYATHQADFEYLSTLMAPDGQIVSYHSLTGTASAMLNQIAAWTGCEIYAHNHAVSILYTWIVGTAEDPTVWNYNRRNVRLRKGDGSPDTFEYMSNPLIAARIILEEREW